MPKTPILILANKQDLPNAITVAEISEKIGEFMEERSFFI